MDYHDQQMAECEPMGFIVSHHQRRLDELKLECDRLCKEYET